MYIILCNSSKVKLIIFIIVIILPCSNNFLFHKLLKKEYIKK